MEAVTTSLVSSDNVSELRNSGSLHKTNSSHTSSDNTAPSFLPDGTVLLDRYMLMRVIAKGGASFIFRARDMLAVLGGNEDQSHIAVKVVRNNEESAGENHQLVLHEALVTRHLSHENIIKVYDYHRDGDISFVTMELIDGEPLSDYIQRLPNKKVPYRFAIFILQAVASALHFAHGQGVVHSDVKPSNILKTESGQIKVIDFATARTSIEHGKLSNTAEVHDGETAPFYGYTLAYASPETILDKPASPSDDVFSLACITYEILAGKHPYGRKPTNEIEKTFRLIKPREVGFWQWLVLQKGLNLDGQRRIKSVKTFISLFHQARYFWIYLILGVSFLVCIGYLAVKGINEFEERNAQSIKQTEFFLQDKRFQIALEELKDLPPIEQLTQLHVLDVYSPTQIASGRAQLQQGIVAALERKVKETISVVEPVQAAAEFNALRVLLKKAKDIYPDSLLLSRTIDILNVESSQLRDTSEFALQQAWEKTDFSQKSASEILASIELLKQSGSFLNGYGPDRSVIEKYHESVLRAIEDLDVVGVSKLFEFSRQFDSVAEFKSVWRAIDKGYTVGAQEWIDYAVSDKKNEQYPKLTMKFYVQPYFQSINKRIETVWTDKDMYSLKDDLFIGMDKYALSGSIPIIVKTRSNLVIKVKNKIKYYQNKKNKKGADNLLGLLAELQF